MINLDELIAEIETLKKVERAYLVQSDQLTRRIERLDAALREADKLADMDCVAHPDFCQCIEPIQRKLEEICSAALEPEK